MRSIYPGKLCLLRNLAKINHDRHKIDNNILHILAPEPILTGKTKIYIGGMFLKSRIYRLADYESVDFSAYQKVFQPDEQAIEGELQRLRSRGIRWEEGSVAAVGDAAVCALRSENPRFRKPSVPIAVGLGLLPESIEQALPGMHTGEEKTVQVNGQAVHIRLLSVKNKYLPELTDAWIAGLGLEGITTVAQYRDSLIGQQKQERAQIDAYEAAQYVMARVRSESEFILCQEDWDTVVRLWMERNSELCRQDGLDIRTMTAADFQGRIPASCYDGVVSLVKTDAWRTLQNYLLGCHYAELDGCMPDEASYEDYIREYQRIWRVTEENARRSNTYEQYRIHACAAYFVDKVTAYVRGKIYLEG